MPDINIYSIGHGNKEIDTFIEELKSFNIEFLIDVRSIPYSKYNPQYNKESLQSDIEKESIKYIYMGDSLGGMPKDPTCYINEKADYNIIKDKKFFKDGIKRLIKAKEKKFTVAVMCSESKPEVCHRSKLIGQELLKYDVNMKHIISRDIENDQHTVMKNLLKGKDEIDLFGNKTGFTSRKKIK